MQSQPPRFLDQVRMALRVRHYSIRTEKAYTAWVKRFILFHDKRHPDSMGAGEVNEFLTHLAVDGHVSASTQNQALAALLFLYDSVLARPLGDVGEVIRAVRPKRLPVVMTREEVDAVLRHLRGLSWIVGTLLYGSGMRLMECLRLRIKDLDFTASVITVREGKGDRDRRTILPSIVASPLREHLREVRTLHAEDLGEGYGAVWLPHALERKYREAPREWAWQWVFSGGAAEYRPEERAGGTSPSGRAGRAEGGSVRGTACENR